MKKIILSLTLLLVSLSSLTAQLTATERENVTAELIKSQTALMTSIEGLNETQLNYKSSPESWSIAECVEHIAIAEGNFSAMLEGAVKTPADAAKRSEVTMSDEKLLSTIKDRSSKVKAPESFKPSGKYGSHKETLDAFMLKRNEHLDYVNNTTVDLRNHYGKLPFATIDGAQVLLFMSGHTERHTAQINEIKANESYPIAE